MPGLQQRLRLPQFPSVWDPKRRQSSCLTNTGFLNAGVTSHFLGLAQRRSWKIRDEKETLLDKGLSQMQELPNPAWTPISTSHAPFKTLGINCVCPGCRVKQTSLPTSLLLGSQIAFGWMTCGTTASRSGSMCPIAAMSGNKPS